MFQQTPLQKLYPHLSFARIDPPSRSVSQPPKPTVIAPPVVVKPKVIEKVIETPVAVEIKEEIKEEIVQPVKVSKKVKVTETKPVVVETVVEPVKITRPNRAKPEPKPEPKRATQIPVKGEKGLQPQYTVEQKRDIFLERLSRKSVKRAEVEVAKIQEVLTSIDYDPKRLKEEEHKVKNRLKLINSAKYFTTNNNIKVNDEIRDGIPHSHTRASSQTPTTSHRSRDESKRSVPVEDGRRRRGRSRSSSSSGSSGVYSSESGD